MINAFQLASAAPVAVFGMFALWAAASKRHWFLRTAVVGGAILVTLLIPAFEIVVRLGVESLGVAAGLAVWRRKRRSISSITAGEPTRAFHVQLSLQTLMLTVVIVAVVTAVASRMLRTAIDQSYEFAIDGTAGAAICLTCVWIVCGRANWRVRLLASPLLAIFWGLTQFSLNYAEHIVSYLTNVKSGSVSEYVQHALHNFAGQLYWIEVISVGMAILCAWLFLVRQAGWFDPFDELKIAPAATNAGRHRTTIARMVAVMLFLTLVAFPLTLFYRLITPTPIPNVTLPVHNGYDDFVAAGCMIGRTAARKIRAWDQLSDQQLTAELAKQSAAIDLLHEGFKKSCWQPYAFKPQPEDDIQAFFRVLDVLSARGEFARRAHNLNMEITNQLDYLRLANAESYGSAAEDYPSPVGRDERGIPYYLWRGIRPRLSAKECIDLAAELWELDRGRETWEIRAERRRIREMNSGWQRHANLILQEWCHTNPNPWKRDEHFRCVTEF